MSTQSESSQSLVWRAKKNCEPATSSSTYSNTAMRKRRNTCASRDAETAVKHAASTSTRVWLTDRGFLEAQKEKTRRWERRVRSFCYRSLRFQVCGLAVARCAPKSDERLVVIVQPIFFLVL